MRESNVFSGVRQCVHRSAEPPFHDALILDPPPSGKKRQEGGTHLTSLSARKGDRGRYASQR